eukprot:362359-Chlamydomonas_euryale.AAC.2
MPLHEMVAAGCFTPDGSWLGASRLMAAGCVTPDGSCGLCDCSAAQQNPLHRPAGPQAAMLHT